MKYIFLLFTSFVTLSSSTPTNLDIISDAIDSLTSQNILMFETKTIKVVSKYSPIQDKLANRLTEMDSNIVITNADQYDVLIKLDSIGITYDENTQTRLVKTIASIYSINNGMLSEIISPIVLKDKIDINTISSIENSNYPFTKGELIEESSFWDDALEPAVFVGAAAVAIYLLFTVRSG